MEYINLHLESTEKIIRQVLEKPAIVPVSGRLTMVPEGMRLGPREGTGYCRHISACIEANVKPYTFAKSSYDPFYRRFRTGPIQQDTPEDIAGLSILVDSLFLTNAAVERIEFDFGHADYDKVRDEVIRNTLRGYEILRADLDLNRGHTGVGSSVHIRAYEEDLPAGITIHMSQFEFDGVKNELEEWYEKLEKGA